LVSRASATRFLVRERADARAQNGDRRDSLHADLEARLSSEWA
jgi:hypothetical protein